MTRRSAALALTSASNIFPTELPAIRTVSNLASMPCSARWRTNSAPDCCSASVFSSVAVMTCTSRAPRSIDRASPTALAAGALWSQAITMRSKLTGSPAASSSEHSRIGRPDRKIRSSMIFSDRLSCGLTGTIDRSFGRAHSARWPGASPAIKCKPSHVPNADLGNRGVECFQQAMRIHCALHLIGAVEVGRYHDLRPNKDILFNGQRGYLGLETCRYANAFLNCCDRRWTRDTNERQ